MEKYTKEKVNIDVYWANVFALILIIPTVLIYGLPYYLIWRDEIHFKDFSLPHLFGSSWIFFIALIIGIIAHELIHGAVWAGFAKNGFKSIQFGVMWKMITPYCHCKEPLKVRQYALGGINAGNNIRFYPCNVGYYYRGLGIAYLRYVFYGCCRRRFFDYSCFAKGEEGYACRRPPFGNRLLCLQT